MIIPPSPLASQLPLLEMGWERFEKFCCALVGRLTSVEHAHLQGGQGDAQQGIDIVATIADGATWAFQCKCVKAFTPVGFRQAISATSFQADRYVLLLASHVSAAVRVEARHHPTWEVWDANDIAERVRMLPAEAARTLVDTHFGPEWRHRFLGRFGPAPFVSVDEFFRPLLDRAHLFHHAWSAIGRGGTLRALLEFADSPNQRIAILAGRSGIGKTKVLQLEQLSRPEIAQVVEHCGIAGPDELVHEILNQAGGLPGLAVTLSLLCLREGVREIVTAGSLFRNVRRSLESVVGERAVPILACFAVGGDAGMPAEAVALALGMANVDVRIAVARLAGGGVLVERFDGSLSVIPPPLRHALVSTEFFEGLAALPIQPLLDAAPVFEQAVLTLIGAKSRRDAVPDPLLRGLMGRARLDPELLESYARLGPDEAGWALVNGTQLIGYVAPAALDEIPHLAIPFLLMLSIGDDRPLHSATDHPLRKIQDWTRAGEPGTPEAVGRRRQLLDALSKWSQGPLWDPVVGCRALAVAFSPVFEDMRADPVDGNRHTLRFGLLQPEEMVELQGLWSVAQEILGRADVAEWPALQHLIHDWLHPSVRTQPDPATAASMRDFAGRIAAEVALRVGDQTGVHLQLARLAAQHGWTVDAPVDPRLEILFPERDLDEGEAAYAEQAEAARAFATELSRGDPGESAGLLVRLHRQADRAGLAWPDFSLLACNTIAAAVSDPGAWIAAFVSAGAPSNFVEPFLERVVTDQSEGWDEVWRTCLESADRIDLRRTAAVVAIRNPQAPPSLVERALAELPGAEGHIESACIRGEIPQDRLVLLLRHPSQTVAVAAAAGLWSAAPRGEIPAPLSDDWRRVVVASLEDEYPLEAIFGTHPEIAWDWLLARLESPERLTFQVRRRLGSAVRALGSEQRDALVERANGGSWLPHEVVRELGVQ